MKVTVNNKMRLNNFVCNTINEKVTKKEKTESLKNDNIWIGMEFEFKLNDDIIDNTDEIESLYDKAVIDYENYNQTVDEYDREIKEFEEETNQLVNKAGELESEQYKLEVSISETEDLISSVEDKIDNIDDDEVELEFLQNRLDDLEVSKSNETSELETIEQHIRDIDNQITERNNENDIEMPYFDGSMYSDYIEYMNGYMGGYVEPDADDMRLIDVPYFDGSDFTVDFVDKIESSDVLDDFPFSHYETGEYGSVDQSIGSDKWAIENDETVPGGLEIKSPPTKLPKFVPKMLSDMLDYIGDVGYTDNDCGLHVHMSLEKTKGIDILKLLLFTEEDYIYTQFPNRLNNQYVSKIKNKLKTDGILKISDLNKMFDKSLLVKYVTSHYDGVSIKDINNGHVEFRYMGGSGYDNDEKKIIDMISSYSYWLSLSSDPDFKRKEYAHKVSRIFNKMELFENIYFKEYIDLYKKYNLHQISEIKVNILLSKIEKKIKLLKNNYKIDKNTINLLTANSEYMRSIDDFIIKTVSDVVHNDDNPSKNNQYYGIYVKAVNNLRK